MTIWIMSEFDREGMDSLFWLQGGKHNETPTAKKNLSVRESPGGPLNPLPFPKKEGRRGNRFPR